MNEWTDLDNGCQLIRGFKYFIAHNPPVWERRIMRFTAFGLWGDGYFFRVRSDGSFNRELKYIPVLWPDKPED